MGNASSGEKIPRLWGCGVCRTVKIAFYRPRYCEACETHQGDHEIRVDVPEQLFRSKAEWTNE